MQNCTENVMGMCFYDICFYENVWYFQFRLRPRCAHIFYKKNNANNKKTDQSSSLQKYFYWVSYLSQLTRDHKWKFLSNKNENENTNNENTLKISNNGSVKNNF